MPLPLGIPPPAPGFVLFIASHGMSQGIAQTGGLQVKPRLFVSLGNAQLGGQWRNISSPVADGVAILFAKYGRSVGKSHFEGTVAYRIRTGVKREGDATAWEFTSAARREFDGWDVRLEVQYSPDEFGSGRSLYVEGGPAIDLARMTRMSANIGRRERSNAPDYTSFNLGLTTVVRQQLSFDARLYATDRSHLAAPFRSRLVVSARLTL